MFAFATDNANAYRPTIAGQPVGFRAGYQADVMGNGDFACGDSTLCGIWGLILSQPTSLHSERHSPRPSSCKR